MKNKKTVFGGLTLLIAAAIVTVIFFSSAQVSIEKDKTTFYLNESGNMSVVGVERIFVLDSKLSVLKQGTTTIKTSYFGDDFIVTRRSKYGSGYVQDVYTFSKNNTDILFFPKTHTIQTINLSGKTLKYEVSGLSVKENYSKLSSPVTFGRMKIEWSPDLGAQSINGVFSTKWSIPNNDYTVSALLVDPTYNNISLVYPLNNTISSQTWYNFSWIAKQEGEGNLSCNLTIDNVNVLSHINSTTNITTNATYSGLLDLVHYWNVTCLDSIGEYNYSNSTFVLTTDTKPPWLENRSVSPISGSTYGSTNYYSLTIDASDITSGVRNATLMFNENRYESTKQTNRFNVTLNNFVAGTYNYNWSVDDNAGNQNTTATYQYTISKAPSVINLTLNGSQSGITIKQKGTINITANLTNGTSTIELFFNGTIWNIGNVSISNVSSITLDGIFNISSRYNSTQNYSGTTKSYLLTVTDGYEPAITLVYPTNYSNASNSWRNFSWVVTDNLNLTTSCNLTVDGTTIRANISALNNTVTNWTANSLSDGSHWWNITCTDGSNINTSMNRVFISDATNPWLDTMTLDPPSLALENFSGVFNFTINASDALNGIKNVSLVFDGSHRQATREEQGNGWARWNVTLTGINAGVHKYRWVANDTVNNMNTTSMFDFVVNSTTFNVVWFANVTLNGTLWAIDYDTTMGGNSVAMSASCGSVPSTTGTSVPIISSPYAINPFSELGYMGSIVKRQFSLLKFPQRTQGIYRTFFSINQTYNQNQSDVSIMINQSFILNISGVPLNVSINTSSLRLYRISRTGGLFNDTGNCIEYPLTII